MAYDPSGVKGGRTPLKNGRKYIIPTPSKGWNQLSFVRWGGTVVEAEARVTMRPIQLFLANNATSVANPTVAIRNAGREVNGVLAVLPLRDQLFNATKIGTLADVQSWELPLPKEGTIWSKANSRSYANVNYVGSQCAQWLQASDGSIVASIPTDGTVFDVTEEHLKTATSMQLRCSAFEAGANPSGSTQVEWNVDVKSFAKREDKKSWSALATIVPVRFVNGMSTMPIPGTLDAGVELFFRAGVDGGELSLGSIKAVAP
jgi:hypothetical protein